MRGHLNKIQERKLYVGSGVEDLVDEKLHTTLDRFGQYQSAFGDSENEYLAKVILNSGESPNEDEIAESLFSDIPNIRHNDKLGYYLDLFVGHVTKGGFRKNGSSGGLVSWTASRLLESGKIDGFIHVKKSAQPGVLFEYGISRTISEIASGAKSRYYPVELSKALKEVKKTAGKYAVVGIPEIIAELRLLAENDPIIKNRIKYYFGLVCGHQKTTKYAEAIAWEYGIRPGDLEDIDFRVKNETGRAVEYDIRLIGKIGGKREVITVRNDMPFVSNWAHGFFKARFSDFTDNTFNELADITFGDAWLDEYEDDPNGNNILILRNKEIADLIIGGEETGDITVSRVGEEAIIRSQQGLIHHTRDELPYRLFEERELHGWVPVKRIKPDDKLDGHRKMVQDVRRDIAEKSHTYYREAVLRDSFDYFKEKMQPYVDSYTELYRMQNEDDNSTPDVPPGSGDRLEALYQIDKERFRASYISDVHMTNQTQLTHRLLISSHSLEKGLSNDGFEAGHGFTVVRRLIGFLNIYREKRYDREHTAYVNTLSTLKVFYNKHKGSKWAEELELIFGDWLPIIEGCASTIGGDDKISAKEKERNDKKSFKDLAEGRFAVRAYADKPVDKLDIHEVIRIALKTPSVCNRQPSRVRAMYDRNVIVKVLEVQGGLAYYDTPPALLLVTANDNSYMNEIERNQGYIDGGLFAMSLLYALEYKKLAACPLHAMFDIEQDRAIRGILNIPDNEKLITFISVGHFKSNNRVCKSARYPVDYILSESDKLYGYKIETTQPQQAVPKVQEPHADGPVEVRDVRQSILKRAITASGSYLDRREYLRAEGAILTLTGYYNYGNVLQRYALQKFLSKRGHEFVSYVDSYSAPRDSYRIGRKTKIKTPLRAVKRFFNYQKPYWYMPRFSEIYPEAGRIENIINFVNQHIWTKPFDPRDNYDKYIVGSDQVWRNWWGNREILGYYFFSFLRGRKVNRIAYAASFGKDKIDEVMSGDDVEYIRPYVEQIEHISVREKTGAGIIEQTWGIQNTKTVVDPTLLLDASDYSKLIDDSAVRYEKIQPIFTYVLGETPEIEDFIRQIQDERQQAATRIRAHAGSENDILPPVELWLKGFRDAELAITNSFHGMMFSVINNTDFIILGREVGGLSRITDFLAEYGIEGRFVDESDLGSIDTLNLEPIDWDDVNQKLEKNRMDSGEWLINAIQNSKR